MYKTRIADLDKLKHRLRMDWAQLDHVVIAAAIRQWCRHQRVSRPLVDILSTVSDMTFIAVRSLLVIFVVDVDNINSIYYALFRGQFLHAYCPFWRCDVLIYSDVFILQQH